MSSVQYYLREEEALKYLLVKLNEACGTPNHPATVSLVQGFTKECVEALRFRTRLTAEQFMDLSLHNASYMRGLDDKREAHSRWLTLNSDLCTRTAQ